MRQGLSDDLPHFFSGLLLLTLSYEPEPSVYGHRLRNDIRFPVGVSPCVGVVVVNGRTAEDDTGVERQVLRSQYIFPKCVEDSRRLEDRAAAIFVAEDLAGVSTFTCRGQHPVAASAPRNGDVV